jgi:hypothetical protein
LLRREPVVLRIVAQRFLLFFDGQVAMVTQPSAGVARPRRPRHFAPLRGGRFGSRSTVRLRRPRNTIVALRFVSLRLSLIGRWGRATSVLAYRGLILVMRLILVLRRTGGFAVGRRRTGMRG